MKPIPMAFIAGFSLGALLAFLLHEPHEKIKTKEVSDVGRQPHVLPKQQKTANSAHG